MTFNLSNNNLTGNSKRPRQLWKFKKRLFRLKNNRSLKGIMTKCMKTIQELQNVNESIKWLGNINISKKNQ